MSDYDFNKVKKALSSALIDDFRGFLVEGTTRLEVADNDYHESVARSEMSKVPGWKYVSGSGQIAMDEFMNEKRAIYITQIPINPEKDEFSRTVGYIKDSFSDIANYRGVKKPEYLILREIALGMGYNVDEHTLLEKKEGEKGTPVKIKTYKAEMEVKEYPEITISHGRSITEGDKPVFDAQNTIIGFISKGKFVNIHNYERYAGIHPKNHENKSNNNMPNNDEPNNLDEI